MSAGSRSPDRFAQDSLMRDAGVDPDIERVVAMRRSLGQPEFARERSIIQLKPNV